MRFRRPVKMGVLVSIGALAVGCSDTADQAERGNGANGSGTVVELRLSAIARLEATEGNEVSGVVTFTETEEGVRVVANVQGLPPGRHGFHVHEYGDCSSPDAESAGGHFNPHKTTHGGPTDTVRHAGDLGNIEAMPDGSAHYEWVDPSMELAGENSVVGRAVIVHAGEDDLTSQPAGNAGERLACGQIVIDREPGVAQSE